MLPLERVRTLENTQRKSGAARLFGVAGNIVGAGASFVERRDRYLAADRSEMEADTAAGLGAAIVTASSIGAGVVGAALGTAAAGPVGGMILGSVFASLGGMAAEWAYTELVDRRNGVSP